LCRAYGDAASAKKSQRKLTNVYDPRAMFRRYQADGAVAKAADIERLTGLLGCPPRAYRDFAAEAVKAWQG
jgi:hypothetical protein